MNLGAMFQTWLGVLTRPGEDVFRDEAQKPAATTTTALIWMVIAAVISALLGFLRGLLFTPSASTIEAMLSEADLPPEVVSQISQIFSGGGIAAITGAGGLLSIVLVPIFFLIGVAILHLLARVFGGQGNFGIYAYLLAAIQAPITILGALLQVVPILGGCISPLLSIYGLVLTYFATKVAHSLSSGKAITVVLIPILIVILLAMCALIAVAGVVVSLFNNE